MFTQAPPFKTLSCTPLSANPNRLTTISMATDRAATAPSPPQRRRTMSALEARISLVAALATQASAVSQRQRIKVAGLGHVDVTVGSALDVFGGNLPYKDVVAWHAKQEASTV